MLFVNASGSGITLTTVSFKVQFNLHTTSKKSWFNPYIYTTIKPDLYTMARTGQMHNVKMSHSNSLHSSPKDLKMLRNLEDLSPSIPIQEIFYPFLLLLLLKYRSLLNSSTSPQQIWVQRSYIPNFSSGLCTPTWQSALLRSRIQSVRQNVGKTIPKSHSVT